MKKVICLCALSVICTVLFFVAVKHIPYMSARLFDVPSRYWLHRVNSPERFNEAIQFFTGVELDIIYHEKEKKFENSHDPEDLSQYDLEETLKMYSNQEMSIGIWFDFKNLTEDNAEDSMNVLDDLLKKYGISKQNCIVESKNWQNLGVFKNGGYRTSYYVTFISDDHDGPNAKDRQRISDIAHSGNVSFVSFGCEVYDFISTIEFPEYVKLLTWSSGSRWLTFHLNPAKSRIRQDDRIQVILVGEKSRYYH